MLKLASELIDYLDRPMAMPAALWLEIQGLAPKQRREVFEEARRQAEESGA